MANFRVIKDFDDLQDNGYSYHAGDLFPRDGVKVTNERLEELSSDKNRRKEPLIQEEIPKKTTPKPKEELQQVETAESTPKPVKGKGRQKKV